MTAARVNTAVTALTRLAKKTLIQYDPPSTIFHPFPRFPSRMSAYDFPVSIALSAGALSSLLFLVKQGTKTTGKIRIETEDEDSVNSDPFNVIQPMDLLDGFPVDEEKFWQRVRISSIYEGNVSETCCIDETEENMDNYLPNCRCWPCHCFCCPS